MDKIRENCPIHLIEHQKNHTENIWKLIVKEQGFSFIDTSSTGSGKTISALWIAWYLQNLYGIQVMIVAPSDASLNNDDGWKQHAKKYNVRISVATTYSSLRGGQGKVSHPWLIPNSKDRKKWTASPAFEKLCQNGLFIIFDEFHHTKNHSMAHFACAALVKMAKKYRKVCRVGLLSYTPGDKAEHIPQILRMSGLITSKDLFKHVPFTREYNIEGYGLGELKKLCLKLAKKEEKEEIENKFINISKAKSFGICKDLYDKYIRSIITFAMPMPKIEHKISLLNAFLETDSESLKLIQNGINLLSNAVAWNNDNQQVGDANQWNLGNIGKSLKMIEKGKLASIARYVNNEIKKNPNKKFVISCGGNGIEHHDILSELIYRETTKKDYTEIVSELRNKNPYWKNLSKDMLSHLTSFLSEKIKPDILNGTIEKSERVNIIRKFQEDSNKSWCLIVSPGVGSESISLQDIHGERKREMLIIPDYHFGRVLQNCGRVVRYGMKSDAKVMIVYSKEASLETSILNSMIKKTKVAKDLLAENQKAKFPGEFPYYIQGKKDLELENRLNQLQNM